MTSFFRVACQIIDEFEDGYDAVEEGLDPMVL